MLLFNSNAIITYFGKYVFLIGPVNTGYNIAIGFTVFERVFYQVYQYLPDFFFIGKHHHGCFTAFLNTVEQNNIHIAVKPTAKTF